MMTEEKRTVKTRYREPERILTPEEDKRKERLMAYLEETSGRLMEWAAELQGDKQEADVPAWPHQSGQKIVNLRKMIWEHELEIKVLENHMVNADRPKFRKCRSKREKFRVVYARLKEAQFAVENWENYFLMFRSDEMLRRTSWMDATFYQLERQDVERKLEACNEFCLPVEEMILQYLSGYFGVSLPEAGSSEKPEASALFAELRDEVHWYAMGFLFLEQYL